MPVSRTAVDADGSVIRVYDLYHRTDPESAQAILASGHFESRCHNTHEAYFTNMVNGRHARRYGDAVVHVEVPAALAVPDEKFNDGEVFFRVPVADLDQGSILGSTSIEEPQTHGRGSEAGYVRAAQRPPHEFSPGAREERRMSGTLTPSALGLTP